MPILYDEPNMSDATLLITVEDLIYRALGSADENKVNFKLVQSILHILARQQRLLEQLVEIRDEDLETSKSGKGKSPEVSTEDSKSPPSKTKKKAGKTKEEKATDGKKDKEKETKGKKDIKEKEKEKDKEKAAKKVKEGSEKEKKQKKEEKIDREDKKKTQSEQERDFSPDKERKKNKTAALGSRTRMSIDVVTQSQFALLEEAVEHLKSIAVPKPLLLPDNKQLKEDIASGSASLLDTMQAMQVNARVKAAEEAIDRMANILTQLATAGAIPEELASKVDLFIAKETDMTEQETSLDTKPSQIKPEGVKSVTIDPKASQISRPSVATPLTPKPSRAASKTSEAMRKSSLGSMASKMSSLSMGFGVTHDDMDTAIRELRNDLTKNLNNLTTKAASSAENALHTAKVIVEKLDVAVHLDSRITTLFSLVGDYAEQLSGFDSGLTTQMQGFQDQVAQIRSDLKSGLEQMENVNNNAETAAVTELTERYDELVLELDSTLHSHKALNDLVSELGGEIHSLVECVEMLREQKSDRDEVIDGLRDKADSGRLAGLVKDEQLAAARADFSRRLQLCHDKFKRQDSIWMTAIKDLMKRNDEKGEIVELLALRDSVQTQLQELNDKIWVLVAALGEPKAALLTRRLAREATCGACMAPAAMLPAPDTTHAPELALPDIREWVKPEPPVDRHICHRWCGGSHTLLTATKREKSPPPPVVAATTKFTDYGDDGRLYMMEDELKPCLECNPLVEGGAGDFQGADGSLTYE